ncbi:Gfo/Idh/MocA family protein [Sphingomonas sp. SRS2]|uniref:Gfo/Idh/MocA family protein n=1 Tax=Sphingomonas sp. SRS2 TaxID=133190 RepID=UPI0006184D0D|nr:Gfo/Idh/MocA family oxidoreductase [Sphingomonas sp. SRS2]KKC26166.1 oxidoreductase [Sphingomonas sp. SRS2]
MAAGDHRAAARIAIVGAGYVADLYLPSIRTFPGLDIVGVWDIDSDRLAAFTGHWGVPAAAGLDPLLALRPDILLNLTNPHAHAAVSRAALEGGVHVWCEKPLAMTMAEAEALMALAASRGRHLASAPCSLLGRAAQTAWSAIRDGRIGKPRLAYAELDDDFLPAAPHGRWRSASGAPWPAADEFRTGCTLEHAGYYLSWLMAMFGPVRRVVGGAARLLDDSQTGAEHDVPDYASASLFFDAMVARLTCSIVARHDRRLRIFGDAGVLEVDDAWANAAPVRIRRRHVIRRRLVNSPFATRVRPTGEGHPIVGRRGSASMNFALGIAEMARAIAMGRAPRLAGDFALHLTEVSLAMQAGGDHHIVTAFAPMSPMDWAG